MSLFSRLFGASSLSFSQVAKAHWDGVSGDTWETLAPPFRPSAKEVSFYKTELEKRPTGSSVLVLGSTPELRTLAGRHTTHPVVADQSKHMLEAMSRFLDPGLPAREVWIDEEWTRLMHEATFDVILGDLVLRQFPIENQAAFLAKMHQMLSDDGVFITRVHFSQPYVQDDAAPLTAEFLAKARGKYSAPAVCGFIAELLDATAEKADRRFSYENAMVFLKDLLPTLSRREDRALVERILRRFSRGLTMSLAPQEEVRRAIEVYFTIRREYVASDYPHASHYPVLVLAKRMH
jgi:hypothetical protein